MLKGRLSQCGSFHRVSGEEVENHFVLFASTFWMQSGASANLNQATKALTSQPCKQGKQVSSNRFFLNHP